MLTIDQTEQRKSGDQRCSVRSDRIAVDDIASSKIIDFESARQALERDRSVDRDAEQINRGASNHLLTPSSDVLGRIAGDDRSKQNDISKCVSSTLNRKAF